MKTVAYCRVSTNKDEQLDSLDNQREFFLEYAKRHDYDLLHIYADEGKSGTRIKNRLQLQKLLEDAKDNKFELVLIKDVSRLARNTVDFLTSIRRLKSYGVKVIFVNYDQSSSESSEFMLTLLSAIAQEESANISKRVKFGKRVNAKNGRVPNLCYGYNKISGDYYNLYIDEEEAKVIRKIFKMYTKNLKGSANIAKYLNEQGIRTKRDCSWTQTSVMRILTNEIYIGKIINGKEEVADFLTGRRKRNDPDKWIIVDKPELQIVSKDIFDKASAIIKTRKIKQSKTEERTSEKYSFSKLIWCECCGHHYRRLVRRYKNTYIRWVCKGRNSNGIDFCQNKTSIDEGDLLTNIKEYVINILTDEDDHVNYIMRKLCKKLKEEDSDFLNVKEYEGKLKKLERMEEKYINLYKEDIISLSELKTHINELDEDRDFINKSLKVISKKTDKMYIVEKNLKELIMNLDNLIDSYQISNSYMKKVIDKVSVDQKGLVRIYIIDIYKCKQEKEFF